MDSVMYRCFLILLLLILAGCSSVTLVQRDKPLKNGSGVVVVEVISNSNLRRDIFQKLSILSESDGELYTSVREESLYPDNTEFFSTSYFAVMLPAGEYRLESILYHESVRVGTSSLYRTVTVPLHDKLSTFSVKAGEVTNLGVLAYIPIQQDKKNDFYLLYQDNDEQFRKTLTHKFPKLAVSLLQKGVNGWVNMPDHFMRDSLDKFVKNNVFHTSEFYESPTGEIYAGARFGQIYVRSVKGDWSNIDTGYTREITNIVGTQDGCIYASGERLLIKSCDSGISWNQISLPAVNGSIQSIGYSPSGNFYLFMITDTGVLIRDIEVLELNFNDNSWDAIKKISYEAPLKRKSRSESRVAYNPELQYVIDASFFKITEDASYNLANNYISPPRFLSDGMLYGASNFHIVVVEDEEGNIRNHLADEVGVGFFDAKTYKSEHIGDWRKIDDYEVMDAVFINRDRGWVLVANGINDFKATAKYCMLYYTEDGGNTWKEQAKLNSFFNKLFLSSAGILFLQNTLRGGEIISSADRGVHWKVERAPALNMRIKSNQTR